jgi:anti-repressor protein
MNELVLKNNSGVPVTNSLLVANKFCKQHKDVLDAIKNLITTSAEFSANLKMFEKSTYLDAYSRPQPMYIMNRDGFSLLVMGFTGKEALQFKVEFIEAFNKMEHAIKYGGFKLPQTFSERSIHNKRLFHYGGFFFLKLVLNGCVFLRVQNYFYFKS